MDFFIIILILLLAFFFINSFKPLIGLKETKTLKKLFIYHLVFGVYYCFFIQGDAINYWKYSKTLDEQTILSFFNKDFQGTYFMFIFNYFPSNFLGLSYFTGTIIYSFIGFMGLTYFYIITIQFVPYNSKIGKYNLFPLLFFFPSLHFWSCAVGKDTLSFFCIAIFCYGILKPFYRLHFIFIALLLSYFVRPHITLFLLLSFGIAFVMSSNISSFRRFFFISVLLGFTISILPLVLNFVKMDDASVESFYNFSEYHVSLLSTSSSGSAVDISSYPLVLKIFTFLFRPLFFDINGLPSIIASIENILLLFLTFKVFRNKPILTFNKAPIVIQAMIWFLIIGSITFSQSLGNLGIMIRMRNMFLPGLLVFFLWSFSYKNQLVKDKQQRAIV
jgi:hypothetical protein